MNRRQDHLDTTFDVDYDTPAEVPDLGRASIWTMLAFEAAMQSRESALRKVEDKRPKEQHTTSADPPLVKPEAPDQLRQRMAWALAQALGVGGL
ncbi:TY5A [Symbiodinium sp. KB8]|nr:TY5A [Symbiodinium sp. KB8]